ncbi:hypothetical protein ACFR9U_01100 [Halorientalis brevis]|uniref:Uncharacterized protein n=1 Tax=Halorientalis brevis TaxID=1126241 RepID=A0ABD6C6T5_9EURY|nr:hypothetical protein [Halorientalis brevis]
MAGYSPPPIPSSWFGGSVLLFAVLLGYALFIVQTPLLVLFPVVLAGFLYVGWRFLLAVEAIADALQRIAQQRERD